MFRSLLIAVLCLGSFVVNAEDDVDHLAERLIKSGQTALIGQDKQHGSFFLLVESLEIDPGKSRDAQIQIVRAMAQKGIAGFFGQKISVSETSTQLENVQTIDGVTNIKVESIYSSFQQVDINQLVKGAQEIRLQEYNGKLYCAMLISQKNTIAAKNVREAMEDSDFQGNIVLVTGMAVIQNEDLDSAQKAAIHAAMKNALEQVMGTMLSSTTQIQDYDKIQSNIFSNTTGFVEKYRIQSEGREGNNYQIKALVTVSKDKLYESYKALLQSMGNPLFFIETYEDRDLWEKFSQFFSDLGFTVCRYKRQADYIIRMRGEYGSLKHPIENTEGTQLSLAVKMFDPESNELIFTISNDPRRAAVFYGNEDRRKRLTVNKAFQQIKDPLHKQINEKISTMAVSGRTVIVFFEGVPTNNEKILDSLKESLFMIPGVSSVFSEVNAINQTATYKLKYSGETSALAKFLIARCKQNLPPAHQPTLSEQKTNSLKLKFE